MVDLCFRQARWQRARILPYDVFDVVRRAQFAICVSPKQAKRWTSDPARLSTLPDIQSFPGRQHRCLQHCFGKPATALPKRKFSRGTEGRGRYHPIEELSRRLVLPSWEGYSHQGALEPHLRTDATLLCLLTSFLVQLEASGTVGAMGKEI